MASIDLVCGALGAGKTTYIKKYTGFLRERGCSFAVIENEFGEAGIDSAFLASDGIDSSELSGGCICCTLKISFHDELVRLAKICDRVIVEPSGIYDITTFFKVISSPELKNIVDSSGVVCLVDPFSLERLTPQEKKLLTTQILSSSCIVISKAEEFTDDQLNAVKDAVCALVGKADLRFADYCDFDSVYNSNLPECNFEADSDHSALFQSARIAPDNEFDADSVGKAVRAAFDDEACGRIIRIKGFVASKDSFYGVNATREHCDIFEVSDAFVSLNVIGTGLSRRKIKEKFVRYK